MELDAQTTLKGPFFKKGMQITSEFAIDITKKLIELGEDRLSQTLRPQGIKAGTNPDNMGGVFKTKQEAGKNASTGHYRRSVNSEMQGAIGRISDSRVVYGAWLEGVSTRNNTTKFKGYFQFRLTGEYIKKNTDKVTNELLPRYIRKMNGV